MSRVFIVQQPTRYDKDLQEYVPSADLSGAFKYGHPIFMLQPGYIGIKGLEKTLAKIEDAMFDYCETDYILATGDPVAISAAVLVAGRKTGGRVLILKWQRLTADYRVFPLNTRGTS